MTKKRDSYLPRQEAGRCSFRLVIASGPARVADPQRPSICQPLTDLAPTSGDTACRVLVTCLGEHNRGHGGRWFATAVGVVRARRAGVPGRLEGTSHEPGSVAS